jgi:hypothetical protein
MAETETNYCPWTGSPGFAEYCTSQCALWLDGVCSFAWLGLWAKGEIVERERQNILAESWAKWGLP